MVKKQDFSGHQKSASDSSHLS